MIDTIKAYLNINPHQNPISLSDISSNIQNPRITEGQSQTGYMNGYLNNIKVTVLFHTSNELVSRLTITGSIPKFLYSNNLTTCSPTDIQTFIDSLSSALDIDVNEAIVTWLDFGLNFLVSRPIPEYIAAIKGYPRLPKTVYQGESVTMATMSRSKVITFYDKIKEIKSNPSKNKHCHFPEGMLDLNILRYEVRYRKHVNRKLKYPESVKLKDLNNIKLHNHLFQILRTTFDEIEISELKFPTSDLTVSSGFLKTYLALIGLHYSGYDDICRVIASQDFDVKNLSVKRSTLRAQLKKLASHSNKLHESNIKSALEAQFDTLEFILNLFYQ
ncbi:phage/plasmid replication protein [Draconibacterium orientale]|uniref:phage/plasmid replication domain-containing protein n=1 Tax=Draconibacterium orientale TaxID=1168034 RepID=UPI0029C0C927|nr:phage/plasmid replication protein [Draconibacterium orientale]